MVSRTAIQIFSTSLVIFIVTITIASNYEVLKYYPSKNISFEVEEQSVQQHENISVKTSEIYGKVSRSGFLSETRSSDTNVSFSSKCELLPYPVSALKFWTENSKKIAESTSGSNKWNSESYYEFIRELLGHLTPDILLKSISTLPKNEAFEVIIEKLMQKMKHKEKKSPIRILVFGGNFTLGVSSSLNHEEHNIERQGNLHIKWTEMLEDIVGFKLVVIENIAQIGTHSMQGTTLVKYGLFPPLMPNPDIIINAYSTNDMQQRVSIQRVNEQNETLHQEEIFDNLQDFIRATLDTQCEHPPLLIILDDFLGNEQYQNVELLAFNSVMKELAGYYEIMSVSYADAVRHIVYADTKEEWFSSSPSSKYLNGTIDQEINPLIMREHLVITWIMAFNLLHSVEVYCNQEKVYAISSEAYFRGRPRVIQNARVLPPLLSKTLSIEYITFLWRKEATRANVRAKEGKNKDYCEPKSKACAFRWFERQINARTIGELNQTLKKVIVKNDGWSVEQEQGDNTNNSSSFGLVATGGKKSFILFKFKKLKKSIDTLTFTIMKGYEHDSEKWTNGIVNITVQTKKNEEIVSIDLGADVFHKQSNSNTYVFPLKKKIKKGNDMTLNIELVNGNLFKFIGMQFCQG